MSAKANAAADSATANLSPEMKGNLQAILRTAIDEAMAPVIKAHRELEQKLEREMAEHEQLRRDWVRSGTSSAAPVAPGASLAPSPSASAAASGPPPLPREGSKPTIQAGPPPLPAAPAAGARPAIAAPVALAPAAPSTSAGHAAAVAAAPQPVAVAAPLAARPMSEIPISVAPAWPGTATVAAPMNARLEELARNDKSSLEDLPLALNAGRRRALLGWIVFLIVAAGLATAAGGAYWSQLHH